MNYRVKNIGIAIGLAALAAILTSVYVVNYKRHVQRGEGKVTVLVAARDIPAGTSGADVIDQKMLKEQTVPRKASSRARSPRLTSFPVRRNAGRVRGRAGEHQALRPAERAGHPGSDQRHPAGVPARRDSDQLLAGTIQNGDHVDVVGNWRSGQLGRERRRPSRTRDILRDILVIRAPEGRLGRGQRHHRHKSQDVQLRVTDVQSRSCSGSRRTAAGESVRFARRMNALDSSNTIQESTRCSSTDPEGGRNELRNRETTQRVSDLRHRIL